MVVHTGVQFKGWNASTTFFFPRESASLKRFFTPPISAGTSNSGAASPIFKTVISIRSSSYDRHSARRVVTNQRFYYAARRVDLARTEASQRVISRNEIRMQK